MDSATVLAYSLVITQVKLVDTIRQDNGHPGPIRTDGRIKCG